MLQLLCSLGMFGWQEPHKDWNKDKANRRCATWNKAKYRSLILVNFITGLKCSSMQMLKSFTDGKTTRKWSLAFSLAGIITGGPRILNKVLWYEYAWSVVFNGTETFVLTFGTQTDGALYTTVKAHYVSSHSEIARQIQLVRPGNYPLKREHWPWQHITNLQNKQNEINTRWF